MKLRLAIAVGSVFIGLIVVAFAFLAQATTQVVVQVLKPTPPPALRYVPDALPVIWQQEAPEEFTKASSGLIDLVEATYWASYHLDGSTYPYRAFHSCAVVGEYYFFPTIRKPYDGEFRGVLIHGRTKEVFEISSAGNLKRDPITLMTIRAYATRYIFGHPQPRPPLLTRLNLRPEMN